MGHITVFHVNSQCSLVGNGGPPRYQMWNLACLQPLSRLDRLLFREHSTSNRIFKRRHRIFFLVDDLLVSCSRSHLGPPITYFCKEMYSVVVADTAVRVSHILSFNEPRVCETCRSSSAILLVSIVYNVPSLSLLPPWLSLNLPSDLCSGIQTWTPLSPRPFPLRFPSPRPICPQIPRR
jgi:hypothetical protein